jgi:hypothetical protein
VGEQVVWEDKWEAGPSTRANSGSLSKLRARERGTKGRRKTGESKEATARVERLNGNKRVERKRKGGRVGSEDGGEGS